MAYSISSGVLNCVGKASLGGGMRRPEFFAFVGGFAAGWPTATWGQSADSVRRIGVLLAATSMICNVLLVLQALKHLWRRRLAF
jgi:hypothetical protein